MTLAEYVDEQINAEDQWIPRGVLLEKGGDVHVQNPNDRDVTLCDLLMSLAVHQGPARVMLRRSPPCADCEEQV